MMTLVEGKRLLLWESSEHCHYLTGKEPGIPDTRKAFDLNKDGVEDDCRIVDAGKWYFLCTSAEGANWDEVSEPTLTGWNGAWLDWDKNGFMDWCHIAGTLGDAPKYISCNFTDGQRIVGTLRAKRDVGFPGTGRWIQAVASAVLQANRQQPRVLSLSSGQHQCVRLWHRGGV